MARRNLAFGGSIPVEPGLRDRRVALEQLTESVGPTKFPVETWTPLCDAYASKQDLGERERFAAAQLSTPATTRWEIGYRADMDPDEVEVTKKRRLVYKSRTYDIVAASEIGRREGIELLTLAKAG